MEDFLGIDTQYITEGSPEKVVSGGFLKEPLFGFETIYITGAFAKRYQLPLQNALLIASIKPGSPAERAGLHGSRQFIGPWPGDLMVGGDAILKIDDQPINGGEGLTSLLNHKRRGEPIELTIFRANHSEKVKVQLEKRISPLTGSN